MNKFKFKIAFLKRKTKLNLKVQKMKIYNK